MGIATKPRRAPKRAPAIYRSRYPNLLLRADRFMISFREGEYTTADPAEIAFLDGIVATEARANRNVWRHQ